ncbi:sigma-70 family RNA polymerase sigma factor [Actinomadura kijaniata]|uniref:sigma-70 family RNA polymerase sigma factor n=1 Tax=Actinomadura kijaniata TaxID=46161 RepID=UPI00082A1C4F|nr:sigma-70 family RNA polymerase sigma factor [Actinomadura kijaniata]
MSAWPSLDRVDDQRLALSLAAGNPGALPQIVDHYATRLFDYCHALLRDSDAAAGALHDAFLAAHAHAGRLREPAWFRGWLYALVRNECLRLLRDPDRPAERHEAPEVHDVFLDAAERAQRLETRRLVHGALAGLRGREREALDLMLRHGLDTGEIAGVLALDEGGAAELVAAARRRLDDALAAAVIVRTGAGDCPTVATLADADAPLDGPLGDEAARRVVRHIESCPICADRCDRTVSTVRLLQVLPVALMPPELRNHVLADAASPETAGMRIAVAARAEPFDEEGWPLPVETAPRPEAPGRSVPPRLWPAVAAAAAVILMVAGAFALMPDSGRERTGAQHPSPTAPAEVPADPERTPGDPPTTVVSPTVTPTRTTPSRTPSGTPSPTRRPPSRSPRPPATSGPPEAAGHLGVSGCSIPAGQTSCPISVTAVNGPVSWSVTGALNVSAAGGGRLRAGQGASVRATRTGPCEGEGGSGVVRFAPSGTATVTWRCAENGPPDDREPRPVR